MTHDVDFLTLNIGDRQKYRTANFVIVERIISDAHDHLLDTFVSIANFGIAVIDSGLCKIVLDMIVGKVG
jgi:hypothetical protein